MTWNDTKNVTASALAKLRNNSKSSGSAFQLVLQQYAIERFLYRMRRAPVRESEPGRDC